MLQMKLVVEELESISVLSEDVGEGKEPEYYLEGIFLQANKKNRNGRIYPMKIMKPAVEKYKADSPVRRQRCADRRKRCRADVFPSERRG